MKWSELSIIVVIITVALFLGGCNPFGGSDGFDFGDTFEICSEAAVKAMDCKESIEGTAEAREALPMLEDLIPSTVVK